jgi:hypothetical protein
MRPDAGALARFTNRSVSFFVGNCGSAGVTPG